MDMRLYYALDGFDLDLVGFDCQGELEPDEPQVCPFKPGCGAAKGNGVHCLGVGNEVV